MIGSASIGVIAPYWNFWESAVEADVRAAQQHLHERCTTAISSQGAIVWNVSDDELSDELETVDLIVVVAQMAVPPARVLSFLQKRNGGVTLVWAAHETPQVKEPFTHESIVLRGGTVGASMLTSSLTLKGIAHEVILGDPESPVVVQALRIACAAAVIRGSRLSVIGRELEGYDFVRPSSSELKRLNIDLVPHTPESFAQTTASIDARSVGAFTSDLDDSWLEATSAEGSNQAVRYTLALQKVMAADQSRAGAINCHALALRNNPAGPGVAPCFALGFETSQGRPWTCTGDINTSLAMLFVSALGHPTMYHEMEAVDVATGEVIFANSGEHDSRFEAQTAFRYSPNPWFPGINPTPILSFEVAPGPASVVAITSVKNRLRVIVAEGEFTARSAQGTGTMSAVFRFGGLSGHEGWQSWVRAGSGHHSCATNEHIAADIEALCRHLEIDCVRVGPSPNLPDEA